MAAQRKWGAFKIEEEMRAGFETAKDELEMLKDEMFEWRDNMEEHFSETDKFQSVEECAEYLEEACEALDQIDSEEIPTVDMTITIMRKKKEPRWMRRDNAIQRLEVIKDDLLASETLTENGEQAVDDLETAIDAVNWIDFPSMFG